MTKFSYIFHVSSRFFYTFRVNGKKSEFSTMCLRSVLKQVDDIIVHHIARHVSLLFYNLVF